MRISVVGLSFQGDIIDQQYHKFSEFATEKGKLDGEKVKLKDIFGKEILVTGHSVHKSKFKDETYLTLQFKLDEKVCVLFTGSGVLTDQVERYVDQIPFLATIRDFGNIYLNEFDHWIKETKGMKYYLRYCDDGVILHSDKQVLVDLLREIGDYFHGLDLRLNPKTSIFPVDRCGIDFLGYRHYRTHVLLRKSSARNLKRRVKNIELNYLRMSAESIVSSVMSSLGWLKHCNSHHLAQKYVFGNVNICNIMECSSMKLNISNPLEGSW